MSIFWLRIDIYRALLAVTRDGAWEAWVAFMLAAVTDTARWTTAKIQAIQRLHADATIVVKTRAGKIYSRELVDMLFAQPYCRIQNLVEADIAKRQTASVYLKQLIGLGMLREVKVGREKLFIHPTSCDCSPATTIRCGRRGPRIPPLPPRRHPPCPPCLHNQMHIRDPGTQMGASGIGNETRTRFVATPADANRPTFPTSMAAASSAAARPQCRGGARSRRVVSQLRQGA